MSDKREAEVREAGRGVVYIAFAKLYFMVAGAIIEFRLPAILANTVFGAYAVVAATISPLNNVLITGSIQAVSRFTAQRPEHADRLQAAGFRMHLYIGVPVALAFMAIAPLVAWFYHDPGKIGPLILAGLIALGYSFYAVFVGTANGRRHFHKQAALDVIMATLRAAGILGLAIAGFGLYGAIGGWVGATAIILIVATFVVGLPKRVPGQEALSVRPLAAFFAGLAAYLILLNLIMSIDQILLKRLVTEWYLDHKAQVVGTWQGTFPGWLTATVGLELEPSSLADSQVGFYRAVQNLARLSYQAILAATFVIFPLVSRAVFENDRDATSAYIRTTMRYSLIFATAIAVVFAANPQPLLDIPYSSDYAYFGAPALIALALGNVAFSLFAIIGTILNGAGLTRQAITVAGVTLGIAALANYLAIPHFEPGRDVLLAAAVATGGAMVFGAALGGWYCARHLGAFLPLATFVRVIAGIAAAVAVGRLLPWTTPLMTMAEACIVSLTFLLTLVVTRELTGADLRAVTSVVRRRKGTA